MICLLKKYNNFINEKNIVASKIDAENYINSLDGFDINNAIFVDLMIQMMK